MASTRGRRVVIPATNKSGGSLAVGDVVIVDTGNDTAVTTTTTGRSETSVGIVQRAGATDAEILVLIAGKAELVNVPASVTRGHYIETHTVAKQATGNSTRRSGSFGQFLTGGTTPTAVLWGSTDSAGAAGAPSDAEYVTYAANGTLSAERVVEAPATGGIITKFIPKGSDETVNNSSALQNDDDLKYTLAANERIAFEADIWFESGATPDFKHAFTVPAGATIKWSNLSFDTSAAIVPAVVVVATSGTSTDHAGSATPQRHVHVWGYVENGANAGDLQYQWAQNTANATDTKVLKNSNLRVWKLA